jgi:hypothetical protein
MTLRYTNWIWGLLGPWADMDVTINLKKKLYPYRECNPAIYPVSSHFTEIPRSLQRRQISRNSDKHTPLIPPFQSSYWKLSSYATKNNIRQLNFEVESNTFVILYWYRMETLHYLHYYFERTYLLTYGAEPFLRSCQLYSHSRTSQHFHYPKISVYVRGFLWIFVTGLFFTARSC